jgi:hypothetical protein
MMGAKMALSAFLQNTQRLAAASQPCLLRQEVTRHSRAQNYTPSFKSKLLLYFPMQHFVYIFHAPFEPICISALTYTTTPPTPYTMNASISQTYCT